jgi:hypothetical protein
VGGARVIVLNDLATDRVSRLPPQGPHEGAGGRTREPGDLASAEVESGALVAPTGVEQRRRSAAGQPNRAKEYPQTAQYT